MWKGVWKSLLALLLMIALTSPVAALSIVIPDRPLPSGPPEIQLQSLQVEATVESGVARVRLDQRFVNRTGAPAEGTYLFPLPPGASVASFQMFVDGQAYTAEVLDAAKARGIYESIVRRNRDPALLQYTGQGLLQARVFPIPSGAERVIRVEYEQILPRDGGLWELSLPLSDQPIPQVSITTTLKDLGAGTVYSPTHQVAVAKRPDGSASVSFEGAQVQGQFRLFFGQESEKLGVNLLTYKAGTEDGYFLLLVNPPSQAQTEVLAKDVLLVIDLSGSMAGEKFEQAKGAALQILGSLGKADRFAVIGFHSDTVTFADELRGAADLPEGMAYVRNLRLGGSTNISGGMARAQQIAGTNPGRPQIVILLTDGQPTAGETDPARISATVRTEATAAQRIFTFGVGFDVNTLLLDDLAQANRGRSDYVRPGENLEAAATAFWRKVGQPVLSDVSLAWEGVKVEEVFPRPMPDLYLGNQLVVIGRYRQGGAGTLTLTGKVNGEQRTQRFPNLEFTQSGTSREYLPRLWANRKVGYLLSEIRRNGPQQELVDEIVALSQRFGIITPYTSFFVNEPGAPSPSGAWAPSPPGHAATDLAQKVTSAPASGQGAVANAKEVEKLRAADSLVQPQPAEAGGAQIRTAGAKTFVFRQGVWVDTAYQGGELIYLKLASDRFLELARNRPDLARYLAVGSPLILVDGETALGIEIPGKEESAVQLSAVKGELPAEAKGAPAPWLGGALGAAALLGVALWLWRRRSA